MPLLSFAHDPGPVFLNDSLYTTCGYKIYRGAVLQFGNGTAKNKDFRFIKTRNGIPHSSLKQTTVVVKELTGFQRRSPAEGMVVIVGSIVFRDGSKGIVEMELMFDRAIENLPALPSELIVPAHYRNNSRVQLMHDLDKLLKLYALGGISQAEYESRKLKLLEQTPPN